MNFDLNALVNICVMVVAFVSGAGTLLAFWEKWVHRPLEKIRQEKAEERNQRLIDTITEYITPLSEKADKSLEAIEKLEKITENNIKSLDDHEVRIIKLEKRK